MKPFRRILQSPIILALREDRLLRLRFFALLSFLTNLLFALFYSGVGLYYHDSWFLSLGVYYGLLGVMRLRALLCRHRQGRLMWRCGIVFILLTLVFAIMSYLSIARGIGQNYGTIPMITIATYTFCKIAMAVMRAVKKHHIASPAMRVMAAVGYAEVAVSLMAMQRSMLTTFVGMSVADIRMMNGATAAGVFCFILWLGIFMIKKGIAYDRQAKQASQAGRRSR